MDKVTCFLCNKEMKPVKTSFETTCGKYDLTISNVDAYRCDDCKEEVISTPEVKNLQNIVYACREIHN